MQSADFGMRNKIFRHDGPSAMHNARAYMETVWTEMAR
jgi:hypothetical protein